LQKTQNSFYYIFILAVQATAETKVTVALTDRERNVYDSKKQTGYDFHDINTDDFTALCQEIGAEHIKRTAAVL